MRHRWCLILSILTAAPLANLAAVLPLPWNHTHVKHRWDEVPANWECLGYPAADTKIDLYIALESHRESALIDALYEVSDPNNQRYVPFNTPPRTHIFTCAAALLQIWQTSFQRASRRACRAEPRDP